LLRSNRQAHRTTSARSIIFRPGVLQFPRRIDFARVIKTRACAVASG
jgi:hypothetical protein